MLAASYQSQGSCKAHDWLFQNHVKNFKAANKRNCQDFQSHVNRFLETSLCITDSESQCQ